VDFLWFSSLGLSTGAGTGAKSIAIGTAGLGGTSFEIGRMKHVILIALAFLFLSDNSAMARDSDKGYLSVKADPATVQVYVDGKLLGPASEGRRMKKFELALGRHTVRLVQNGYVESKQNIYVTPGKATMLGIALSPEHPRGLDLSTAPSGQ